MIEWNNCLLTHLLPYQSFGISLFSNTLRQLLWVIFYMKTNFIIHLMIDINPKFELGGNINEFGNVAGYIHSQLWHHLLTKKIRTI